MKIIDAHTHFSNIAAFHYAAETSGVDFSYDGLINEQAENEIVASVCMGLIEMKPGLFPDKSAPAFMCAFCPGELNDNYAELHFGKLPPLRMHEDCPDNMHVCIGVNPHNLDDESVNAMRILTKSPGARIVGFKIYAGYYHFSINDPVYTPVYKLAAERGLTVAIHTGDTYAETALLEYSHPLAADRLAVNFRDVNFMLCHMGDPWIMDACEVAYKNRNVYLDISGLLAGDAAHIAATQERHLAMHHYAQGLQYLNQFDKVLFGTDWPLVPLGAYIEFCKKLIPVSSYDDVFFNNAVKLFGLKI